ncbi:Cyclin A [Carpediemonas membranifera]|uniref:Cyclin A n=1 Tax=Carpediemonas membranifera TaxID=201153 RepID=A0A8J6E684_9EUKA|nr:Cyclin A [Carpediemonas membranifera]|eukprot:KAG9396787.1 Cyclin A [Carpediemonas membranifera]
MKRNALRRDRLDSSFVDSSGLELKRSRAESRSAATLQVSNLISPATTAVRSQQSDMTYVYASVIKQLLIFEQNADFVFTDYLSSGLHHTVEPKHVYITTDWMFDVSLTLSLNSDVKHLALTTFHRYLSGTRVRISQMQLLAAACILIAVKHDGEYTPDVINELMYMSDFTFSQPSLIRAESIVLEKLDWRIAVPTVVPFLKMRMYAVDYPKSVNMLAFFLADVAMQHSRMLAFTPSYIAEAAMVLSQSSFRETSKVVRASRACRRCIETLLEVWGECRLDSVIYKQYRTEACGRVSDVLPPNRRAITRFYWTDSA